MLHTSLNIDYLQRKLIDQTIGSRIFYHDALVSTMDEARDLAERNEPDGTLVVVEEQKSGRGRFNRIWISPRSQNLSFSIVLRPSISQLPYINMAATLAVAKCVSSVTGRQTRIKWPNDVRIDGLKISGILIETVMLGAQPEYTIVGIGVNVNFNPAKYPEIACIATSLRQVTGRVFDRNQVLTTILMEFEDLYSRVKLGESLTTKWSEILETLGCKVKVRWQDSVYEGIAKSVDDNGSLIIIQPDGTQVIVTAGEVTMQI